MEKVNAAVVKKSQSSEDYLFETETLLGTGPSARLTADAVARILYLHEHLGRIVFVQLFKSEHVMHADLVTAAAADAGLLVDRHDELRGIFGFVPSESCNVSHGYLPFK
jgi:hypothetical protein